MQIDSDVIIDNELAHRTELQREFEAGSTSSVSGDSTSTQSVALETNKETMEEDCDFVDNDAGFWRWSQIPKSFQEVLRGNAGLFHMMLPPRVYGYVLLTRKWRMSSSYP